MGAGSGVGSMGVQIAHLLGARVLSTVGADDKIERAKMIGADVVINHAREDVTERIRAATDGRGVDVVVEHVGQAVWESCLRSLTRGGRLGHVWLGRPGRRVDWTCDTSMRGN